MQKIWEKIVEKIKPFKKKPSTVHVDMEGMQKAGIIKKTVESPKGKSKKKR